MMQKYYWNACSPEERLVLLPQLEACIAAHGFVTDYHPFSDLSLALTVELAATKLPNLYLALGKLLQLDEVVLPPAATEVDCVVMLHVYFSRGSGTLTHSVPAVPG